MTSRERIQAVLAGHSPDHVPLTTWCFGLPAPPGLRWELDGEPRDYWYSLRMEHLHTTTVPWTLEDDFRRVRAWRSLGVDDVLDVSIPWSVDPEVSYTDRVLPAGQEGPYPVLVREYETPAGHLRHAVRQTEPEPPGWPVQPDHVPLIEDFNIPRAVEHAVSSPADIPVISYLFAAPDSAARHWFAERMAQVAAFAREEGVAVQAWSAFGMDGVVWLTGTEGAIMMALDQPEAFAQLVDLIAATDYARTELALTSPDVDLVVQRGWYSSTDFWSPALFDRYVFPHLQELAALVHRHGRKLAYVMTTGVEKLGPRLADAGVDLLYFVDPLQDGIDLAWAREHLADRMALVGGLNALTLGREPAVIHAAVQRALETLGPTGRFILHPVDALFPDTPWRGVEAMIAAWAESW
ncbi:MAG: hypothetical protein HPY69_13125 [Armatimonadetes bacterium]|nr:hypothetical protein [Armatimonadota bacterium]